MKIINCDVRNHDPRPAPAPMLAMFDLSYLPGTFDFLAAILNVDLVREENGFSEVEVFFNGPQDWRPERHQGVNMLNEVHRPLLQMLGLREARHADRPGVVNVPYNPSASSHAFVMRGRRPRPLLYTAEAVMWAKQFDGCVTVTLRDQDHQSSRNSRVEEWAKAIAWLVTRGERVVIVPDSSKVDRESPWADIANDAAADLHKRLALYRAAKTNLFVSNGPAAMCCYSDLPYLNFVTAESVRLFEEQHVAFDLLDIDLPPQTDRQSQWQAWFGFEKGGQFPWSSPRQRFVWADDTADNIIAAYEATVHV